jgi:hypothetical protein
MDYTWGINRGLYSWKKNRIYCKVKRISIYPFNPNTIENGWSAGFKGGMLGYNTCLVAAIAWSMLTQDDPAALAKGIQAGLSAMRVLHAKGYQNESSKPQNAKIAFPYRLVASDIQNPTSKYVQSEVRDPLGVLAPVSSRATQAPRTGMYTILSQQCCDDLLSLARQIVQKGPFDPNIEVNRLNKRTTGSQCRLRGPALGNLSRWHSIEKAADQASPGTV